MKVKIFLVLLLCVLHQVHGSKSTKKKGGSRLMKWAKKCLIAVAVNYGANEIVNVEKPQVADSISLACKYYVPDRNAGVMMNFVKCAKDQEFEKYMFDNSENCPKIKDLYRQAKSDGNCALKTPKIIPNGALARFRGEQLNHAANVEMLKEYLLSYPGKDGARFESGEFVSDFIRKSDVFPKTNFDFFQFTNLLEVAKIAYPDDTEKAVLMALGNEYKDVNVHDAKRMLELTMLAYPNDTGEAVVEALGLDNILRNINADDVARGVNGVQNWAKIAYPDKTDGEVAMALKSEYKYFNVERAKKLFGLTKLIYPNHTSAALLTAWDSTYKDINVDNATKLLELTKLAYPDDTMKANRMALNSKYKDINVEHAKRLLELTTIAFPNCTSKAVDAALEFSEYKDFNVDNAKQLLESIKLAFPNDTGAAAAMVFVREYKDANLEYAKKLLELTKLAYPDDPRLAVGMLLDNRVYINADNAKKLFEFIKPVYPDDARSAAYNAMGNVNADHTKKLFELIKLAYPNEARVAVEIALRSEYKNVNVEHAKRVFQLTKLAYPDMKVAVTEALNPKYNNIDVGKVNKKYEELKSSWLWHLSSEQNIMKEALKVTYPKVLKEDF